MALSKRRTRAGIQSLKRPIRENDLLHERKRRPKGKQKLTRGDDYSDYKVIINYISQYNQVCIISKALGKKNPRTSNIKYIPAPDSDNSGMYSQPLHTHGVKLVDNHLLMVSKALLDSALPW